MSRGGFVALRGGEARAPLVAPPGPAAGACGAAPAAAADEGRGGRASWGCWSVWLPWRRGGAASPPAASCGCLFAALSAFGCGAGLARWLCRSRLSDPLAPSRGPQGEELSPVAVGHTGGSSSCRLEPCGGSEAAEVLAASSDPEMEPRAPSQAVSMGAAATLVLHWVSGAEAGTLQVGPAVAVREVKAKAAKACGKASFCGGLATCMLICKERGALQDSSSMGELGYMGRRVCLQMVFAPQCWNPELKGANALLHPGGCRVSRSNSHLSCTKATVFCSRPARQCCVRLLQKSRYEWAGSLQVGFALQTPEALNLDVDRVNAAALKGTICSKRDEAWTPWLTEGAIVEWELLESGHMLVRIGDNEWRSLYRSDVDSWGEVFPMASVYGKTIAIELVQ